MPPFLINLAIGLGMSIIGSMMLNNTQQNQKKPSLKDRDSPTSDSNRLIPFVIGTVRVDGLNILHTADEAIRERMVNPPGGKK